MSVLQADQQEITRQLWQALQSSQRILVGTHEHPDGDALGSSLALWHVLRALGKDVTVYLPDAPAPEFFSFLPHLNEITTEKPDAAQFDAIVLVDYTQLYRTHLEAEFKAHAVSICIDH